MNKLTFSQLNRLIDAAVEEKKTHYTLLSKAVQVGFYNANSKKQVSLFNDSSSRFNKKQVTKISQNTKENELDFILNFK